MHLPVPDIGRPLYRSLTAPLAVGPNPEPDEIRHDDKYINPLDESSRWYLSARASALRQGAKLGFGMQHRFSPSPPDPTKVLYLDSTLGADTGKGIIKVDVWVPECRKERHFRRSHKPVRPALINFHGGGFVLGQGTDDARWAVAAMSSMDAVVFSVNYRLAPSYPFPKPAEDCVDSILQICDPEGSIAKTFNLDLNRIFLSGFSAGGNLALASWLILASPSKWPSWGYTNMPPQMPQISGLSLFYPLLDWTVSRPRKRASCARPDQTLPSSMTDLFDASYIYPPLPVHKRTDWRLSPGLMSNEMIDHLPPMHLCLCEYDMLLTEGLTFAERLRLRGRSVEVRIVAGAKHAWDKPPGMVPKKSMHDEYAAALKSIQSWTEQLDRLESREGSEAAEPEKVNVGQHLKVVEVDPAELEQQQLDPHDYMMRSVTNV
jgi:acetyl esterase/lipase